VRTWLASLTLVLALFCVGADNPRLIGYPSGGKIMGFRGLDTQTKAPNLEDGRSPDLLNVLLSSAFDLRKRYGLDPVNETLDDYSFDSPAVTGIFDTEYSNGNSYTIVFVGDKLKYDNSGEWDDATVGTGSITSNQNYQWQCLMALDYAVCTNGYDPLLKVQGDAGSAPYVKKTLLDFSSLATPVTRAGAHIFYRNYLIVGDTTEGSRYPTRFRWSDVGTIETWSDENYTDIASLAGDEIVAFKEMYGELFVIMRKSVWKASLVGGDDVFTFTKVIDGIGGVSRTAPQVVAFPDNKLAIPFLTEDKKIYLFNGITVFDIGQVIQPTLDDLAASRLKYAAGIFDGENYYLSVSDGSSSTNDIVLVYNVDIQEWSKFDQVDANCFARVKESTSVIRTYLGNYAAFVYWMDNSDLVNDVNGATGIFEDAGVVNTDTETGAQVLIDTEFDGGDYTGAIVRITSGTAAGEERVITTQTPTGVIVATAFSTTPDSTSNYSIGDIDTYYKTKWIDFGDAPRMKSFKEVYFWAAEESAHEVEISYYENFGAVLGSEPISLSPSSTSLWDSGLWDEAVWGTTGDKMFTTKLRGLGRTVQLEFRQSGIDKSFHIYGYHILAEKLDVQ
jgi:hypothetical protein